MNSEQKNKANPVAFGAATCYCAPVTGIAYFNNGCVRAAMKKQAVVPSIENEYLVVSYDLDAASFSIGCKTDSRMAVKSGALYEKGIAANVMAVDGDLWGKGEAIEVKGVSGAVQRISLFEGIPFAFFQTRLANTSETPVVLKSVNPASLSVEFGCDTGALKALGTKGLTGVARGSDDGRNPGSYSFLAIAEAADRHGIVCGWLTHQRGSGVVFSDIVDGRVRIDGKLEYGRLELVANAQEELETFVAGFFADARLGLEAYADLVARRYAIKLPPQPVVYCTWYHARSSNETDVARNTECAAAKLKPYGLAVIQIDDGWQAGTGGNGPRKDFTQIKADGPYKSGMKPLAGMIRERGFMPGIWFMPFAGTWNDPCFAEKQHWFAQMDGKPFEVKWGGTCFDLSRPEVQEYVRSVAKHIIDEWGYRYIKIDGLWTGTATRMCYVQSGYSDDGLGETELHDKTKTHMQAYRTGLEIVREQASDGTYILGCNVAQNMRTLGGSFGLVDGMRIGPDNDRKWSHICRGPFSGSNLYFLHGRVWHNDPDPLYVGSDIPLQQARTILSWVAISGQLNTSSENFVELSPERIDMLRRSMPSHGLKPRPVDLFENNVPQLWLLSDDSRGVRRDIVGCFNWDEISTARIEYPMDKLGLSGEASYVGYDYWAQRFVPPFSGHLKIKLSPAGCAILSLRQVRNEPQVLGTSRHVTQGIIDIIDEQWSLSERTLSGISDVVGQDTYELRLAADKGKGGVNWRARRAGVAPEDDAAGVKASVNWQDGPYVRLSITSPVSRQVKWWVIFE
jgi:hypothetical protein